MKKYIISLLLILSVISGYFIYENYQKKDSKVKYLAKDKIDSIIISEKCVPPGLWTSCIHLKFNHLRTLYVKYNKLCAPLVNEFSTAVQCFIGKKL